MSDKSHEDAMALLDEDGAMHISEDQGALWEMVTLTLPPSYFDNLSESFKGFMSALVALAKSLLSTRPNGPDDYVTDVAWPGPNRLYVATDDGDVYLSTDMGKTFTPISVGITDGDISLTAGGERIRLQA